jgi:hypothetical protein
MRNVWLVLFFFFSIAIKLAEIHKGNAIRYNVVQANQYLSELTAVNFKCLVFMKLTEMDTPIPSYLPYMYLSDGHNRLVFVVWLDIRIRSSPSRPNKRNKVKEKINKKEYKNIDTNANICTTKLYKLFLQKYISLTMT